jgi:hypothetical protein
MKLVVAGWVAIPLGLTYLEISTISGIFML